MDIRLIDYRLIAWIIVNNKIKKCVQNGFLRKFYVWPSLHSTIQFNTYLIFSLKNYLVSDINVCK